MRIKTLTLFLVVLFNSHTAFGENYRLGEDLKGHTSPNTQNATSLSVKQMPSLLRGGADVLRSSAVYSKLNAVDSAPRSNLRGQKEIDLYKNIAPSVVFIFTDNGLGSGSVVSKDGRIITNWHVVGDALEVGVIFKPLRQGSKVSSADSRRAKVLAVDQVLDLALLQVLVPPKAVKPIALAKMDDISVGSDVHAIGHPTGESWTYTTGIVSQIRADYEWSTEVGVKHKATIIQTQTPINPGNSGGPLLDDAGRMIGVNSFVADGEGLNYAVSVDDVTSFIKRPINRTATKEQPQQTTCELRELESWRDEEEDNSGIMGIIDTNCDGEGDFLAFTPDNPSDPYLYFSDQDGDGKIDTTYIDQGRDGEINISIMDVTGNGNPDLIGYHRDGDMKPYRVEPYTG